MKWFLVESEHLNDAIELSADRWDDAVAEALSDFYDAVVYSEEDLSEAQQDEARAGMRGK